MGTLQVTYDDFSGGHYMGNRAASLPKNTWYGTNALLNSQGELVPSGAVAINQFLAPTGSWNFSKPYGMFREGSTLHIVATWEAYSSPSYTYDSRYIVLGVSQGSTSSSNYALSEIVLGQTCFGGDVATLGVRELHFIDADTDNVCRVDSTGSVAIVSTALAGTYVRSIAQYKSRMVAWPTAYISSAVSPYKLFYSDPTMTSWDTTDYYEFPGIIQTVLPRSNDLVVITDNGVYSVTGVLGSSVNIQLITPVNEQMDGMQYAKSNGRSILFHGNDSTANPALYELLGATTSEVARFNQPDVDETAQSNDDYDTALGVELGGTVCSFLDNGVMYVRRNNGSYARFLVSGSERRRQPIVAEPTQGSGISDILGNAYVAAMDASFNLNTYLFAYDRVFPCNPYALANGTSLPASAIVQLSEYWHSKPLMVRELMVEATYDTDELLNLSGNASVMAQIIPTGAIDYTVNETPLLTSSTQTYTTALTSVNANGSRVLHRFRVDNAIRGYGFYPKITWQGCRIRRVIAVCED